MNIRNLGTLIISGTLGSLDFGKPVTLGSSYTLGILGTFASNKTMCCIFNIYFKRIFLKKIFNKMEKLL